MVKKQTQLWRRRIKRIGRRLRLLMTPHAHNHYRPHLVRRYGLFALVVGVVGIQFLYNYTHTGSVLGRVTTVTPTGLLARTNEVRTAHGLSALHLDVRLSQAAANKARDMLTRGYWDHAAPDGTAPWVWIDQTGYGYIKAGENLAKNFSTADATVVAWMDSPAHKENMLDPAYHDVGFAAVNGTLDGSPATIIVAFYGAEEGGGVVAGQSVDRSVRATSTDTTLSLAARIGTALQSLTPAASTSLMLLLIAATVALTAHFYRSKLPKQRRESWYRHHGIIKASGILSVAAFIVLLYGGGQL